MIIEDLKETTVLSRNQLESVSGGEVNIFSPTTLKVLADAGVEAAKQALMRYVDGTGGVRA